MKNNIVLQHKSIAILIALTTFGFTLALTNENNLAFANKVTTPVALTNAPSEGFADLVENVKPAVVNISTRLMQKTSTTANQGTIPDLENMSPFMRRFFQQRKNAPKTSQSLGSGFIIDETGFIVTNNHVIAGAQEIEVIFDDGNTLPATLIGSEKETDLALLKVESDKPLPFVQLGDDKKSRVGDWIIAIGNPFGLGGTTTTGIISARGRDINSGPYDDFIQIDAPINRGNSGGPLFNLAGEVIGVNSVIYSPNGGNVGIGFAIPSGQVSTVVAQLKEFGTVERGWLGVHIQKITEDIATGLGLDSTNGALIAKVQDDSPAARAGIQAGDVITSVNDIKVVEMNELPLLIGSLLPGSVNQMIIIRDKQNLSLDVEMNPRSDTSSISSNAVGNEILGLTIDSLDDDSRQQLKLSKDLQGALITNVDESAINSGLIVGDIILQAGKKPVNSPKDVHDSIELAKNNDQSVVLLQVHRKGADRFVALRIS